MTEVTVRITSLDDGQTALTVAVAAQKEFRFSIHADHVIVQDERSKLVLDEADMVIDLIEDCLKIVIRFRQPSCLLQLSCLHLGILFAGGRVGDEQVRRYNRLVENFPEFFRDVNFGKLPD